MAMVLAMAMARCRLWAWARGLAMAMAGDRLWALAWAWDAGDLEMAREEKAKPLNFFKFKGFGISQGLWRSAGFRVF